MHAIGLNALATQLYRNALIECMTDLKNRVTSDRCTNNILSLQVGHGPRLVRSTAELKRAPFGGIPYQKGAAGRQTILNNKNSMMKL